MTRLIPYILLLLMPGTVLGQRAKVEWKERAHDFGTVAERGGKVSCEFTFTNRGEAPLIIRRVEPGCGCAVARWPRRPVAPGEEGRIVVTFNPQGREGKFLKRVMVYTNAAPPNHELRIEGSVSRTFADILKEYPHEAGGMRYDTAAVTLGRHAYRVVRLLNAGKETLTVERAEAPEGVEIRVAFKKLRPKEEGHVIIALEADAPRRARREGVAVLRTSEGKEIRIRVGIAK